MVYSLQGFKAELFKALAHPTRIKMLEHLRSGERTVSALQALLDVEPSTVSQQLAILRARSIVEGRKQGSSVYYRVPDPMIFDLLDVARQIFVNYVGDLQAVTTAGSGAATSPAPPDRGPRGDPDQATSHDPADRAVAAPHSFADQDFADRGADQDFTDQGADQDFANQGADQDFADQGADQSVAARQDARLDRGASAPQARVDQAVGTRHALLDRPLLDQPFPNRDEAEGV